MIYKDAKSWQNAAQKRVMLFGMSGLGKTYVSTMLRESRAWFHYSVDYRIGTRYMGEHIADNFKAEAMKNPFLAELLRSDSIYVGSNITFENLAPLSTYLGKPGDPARGGLAIAEYRKRQCQHQAAEIAALHDAAHFIERADTLYGYQNFVCDSGGSICEVADPFADHDPVLQALADKMLLVWIEGSEDHTSELIRRFDRAPKPMYYQPAFLDAAWQEYLKENKCLESEVDPDSFIRWTYARALAHRQPRYAAMAKRYGVKVCAEEIAAVKTPADFEALIGRAIDRRLENERN